MRGAPRNHRKCPECGSYNLRQLHYTVWDRNEQRTQSYSPPLRICHDCGTVVRVKLEKLEV